MKPRKLAKLAAKLGRAIRNGWQPGRGPVGEFSRKRRMPAGRRTE
jgi:hypothetical protein